MSISYTCHLCQHKYTIWSDDDIVSFGGAVKEELPIVPEDPEQPPEEFEAVYRIIDITKMYPEVLKVRCPSCHETYNVNVAQSTHVGE